MNHILFAFFPFSVEDITSEVKFTCLDDFEQMLHAFLNNSSSQSVSPVYFFINEWGEKLRFKWGIMSFSILYCILEKY